MKAVLEQDPHLCRQQGWRLGGFVLASLRSRRKSRNKEKRENRSEGSLEAACAEQRVQLDGLPAPFPLEHSVVPDASRDHCRMLPSLPRSTSRNFPLPSGDWPVLLLPLGVQRPASVPGPGGQRFVQRALRSSSSPSAPTTATGSVYWRQFWSRAAGPTGKGRQRQAVLQATAALKLLH